MRKSIGLAVLFLLVLTACGRQFAPSGAAGSAINPDLARVQPHNACTISGFFVFHGSCTEGPVLRGGETYRLKSYKGYTVTFQLAPNGAPPGATFAMSDATGKHDITGTYQGLKFSPYPSKCDGSSCPGKAFLYLLLQVKSTAGIPITGNSSFSIESTSKIPGKSCLVAFNGVVSGKLEWRPELEVGAPKGDTLRFNFVAKKIDAGIDLFALACS
jgi:hypothetical protein